MRSVTFITGNSNKAAYLERQLGVKVSHEKVDLDELQSLDLHEIVKHKLEQAYAAISSPVLVEDVSLEFSALNGLPGPYIKWFVEQSGEEACCRMLDSFSDRTAVIRCTFGYFDGERMEFFDSSLNGRVSQHPMGSNGFGFDTFFIMDGYDVTRAELDTDTVEKTYAEYMKPFKQVRDFLQND